MAIKSGFGILFDLKSGRSQTQGAKSVAREVYKMLSKTVMKSLPTEKIPIEWSGSWSDVVAASDGHLALTSSPP